MPVDTSLKILLVEDAATMRKMEARILNQIGFTDILEAADGNEALVRLESEDGIGLIISDWAMPNLDGYQLLQRVRADERFGEIPFLMATGHGDKAHVEKAMAGGASGVVAKPFSPEELRGLIDEVFGAAPKAAAPKEEGPRVSAEGRVRLRMAHIQITDHLPLGVLRHQVRNEGYQPRHFDLDTLCMPGWNPVQKALEQGEVDGAFILAPAAMDLFSYGVDIRLVLFAHRNGSICVRSTAEQYGNPQAFFKHKTFLIPHKMSIHNMLAHMYFTRMGLRPGVAGSEAVNVLFDVVPPVGMPEFLAQNPDTSGFLVAEPIGSRAVAAGVAERQFLSSEIWEGHPCCVVVFRKEFIDQYPEAVREFTEMLVAAGRFIKENIPQAAAVAVDFLDPQGKIGLTTDLLETVLSDPQGISTDDLYPVVEDLEAIQDYMTGKMGIGRRIDLGEFVDLRFADAACGERGGRQIEKRGPDLAELAGEGEAAHREGKYLVFSLGRERYGIGILDVREIVGMAEINRVPGMPACYRGVIKLRERVIPVLDMRCKLGRGEIEYNDRTCIIIVEVSGRRGSTLQGIVVDSVSEVALISEEQVEDAPAFNGGVDTSCILGMAKLSEGVTVLLDMDQLLQIADPVALAG